MRIKKTFIILAGLFIFLAGLSAIVLTKVGAQTVFAKYGLGETAKTAELSTKGKPAEIIGNVIGAGLTFVGVLFLVLMIYGGIIWMLARGNEQQSKKALDTIIAAVIGLIIVIGSYALTSFVFRSVEGGQTTTVGSCQVDTGASGCTAGDCINLTDEMSCVSQTDNCCNWSSP